MNSTESIAFFLVLVVAVALAAFGYWRVHYGPCWMHTVTSLPASRVAECLGQLPSIETQP